MKVSKFVNFKDGDEVDIYNDPVTFKSIITFDSSTVFNGALDVTSGTVLINGAEPVTVSGNQTISGTKTFNNIISGDISGNAATVTNGVYTDTQQNITGRKTFTYIVLPTSAPSGTLVDGTIWLT